MLASLQREWAGFTRSEKLFVFFAMLCSFLISADYSIIRPVSNSLFLTTYGSHFFPYAWLATVPLNLFIVGLYNKYLPKLGCFKCFAVTIGVIGGMTLFSALFLSRFSWLPFVFYIWKEVYILLCFQQLWSVIHSIISFERAKYLYGFLFGCGALGAALGSTLPGFFAAKLGSEQLLFASLPLYLLLILSYYFTLKQTSKGIEWKIDQKQEQSSMQAFWHGLKLIGSSRYLLFILLIVSLMQISSSLIDFQFNHALERAILEKDLRTEYTGKIFGIIHTATISLQLFGSFLLLHFLGVKRSHLFVPFLLCLNSIAYLFFPVFGVISFAYISVKSCDFSLFGVIKELLYVPLSPDEKFRAKAVIDVFAYRSSKAVASTLILFLQTLLGVAFIPVLNGSSVILFIIWLILVATLLKSSPLTQFKRLS